MEKYLIKYEDGTEVSVETDHIVPAGNWLAFVNVENGEAPELFVPAANNVKYVKCLEHVAAEEPSEEDGETEEEKEE